MNVIMVGVHIFGMVKEPRVRFIDVIRPLIDWIVRNNMKGYKAQFTLNNVKWNVRIERDEIYHYCCNKHTLDICTCRCHDNWGGNT